MSKVFRFHNGANSIEHWQDSQPYGKLAIDAIKDPAGATASREITSIPSPFARIDLVKAAFDFVATSNNPDGNTIYHKMVSDSLDVGEIFFNIDKHLDKISIIVWDKDKDLKALIHSENARHRQLGNTLEIFLRGDASANNFNDMQRLYLLNYKKGPNPINIIGGTSPASLFFTSANKLFVDIPFGKDIAFDDSYQPLYKRDFAYQKFIFGLRKFTPNFAGKFSTVHDYLDMNFRLLNDVQREVINNYKEEDFETEFERLTAGSAGSTVEVLGVPLRKKTGMLPKDSGFIIDAPKYSNTHPPLVLPVDDYSEKTMYVSAEWDSKSRTAMQDNRPLKDRTLPFDGTIYPYLTISDFLEPYIMRTVYPLNKKFFDGNFSVASGDVAKGYLLPLKKEYFDYFDAESLQKTMPDGKNRIEIKQMHTGGVQVILRIPIQKGKYITYERMYYPPATEYQIAEPDIDRNRGTIVENQFSISVYPFFKVTDADNHYRVALMDRDILEHTRHNKYALRFFKNTDNKQVTETARRERSTKAQDNIASLYYVLEESFDYMELDNGLAKAIVLPKFNIITQGTAPFSFAVDFGTTNTHIEFKKGNEDPKPFEINEADVQIASLHDNSNPETVKSMNAVRANPLADMLPHEFVPELINGKQEVHFPQRTAISSKKGISFNHTIHALADFNIPFLYERQNTPANAEIKTNLKWADVTSNTNNIKIIEAYFENLMLLMRAKVLLNGGNLAATKLLWLYPSSMNESRRRKIGEIWEKLLNKYFDATNPPKSLSESVAPFYYFNKKEGIAAGEHSAISIDIGGETTDVVVYLDDKPNLLTSFRFAANAVFGDFHGRSAAINGFVNKYKNLLEEKGLSSRFSFRDIERSEDIISYLFSIEKSDGLKKDGKDFSFNKLLQADEDFRIIFLLFYSSIIYHIAKILEAKGIKAPAYVTLSGTGSKIVDLAEGSNSLSAVTELTQLIFTKVLQREKPVKLEIKKVSNPKEISCIGALLLDDNDVSIENVTVLSGARANNFSLKYNDITEETERDVIMQYEDFIRFFFSLNNEFNFRNKFDLNPALFSRYKEYLEEKSLDYLKTGLKEKQKELQDMQDTPIEETLFFYPVRGALNHLAQKIFSALINTEK